MRISEIGKSDENDIGPAMTYQALVRTIYNNEKMGPSHMIGKPIGKPFLVDLIGPTREAALLTLDTKRRLFVRWW